MLGNRVVQFRFIIIAICVVITGFSFWIAKDLRVATDLSEMLPNGHVLVEASSEFDRAFGSGERVYIAIEGKEKASRHTAAQKLIKSLKPLDAILRIEAGQPESNQFLDAPNGDITLIIVTPNLEKNDFVQARKDFFVDMTAVITEVSKSMHPHVTIAYTGGAFVQDYEADGVLEQGILGSVGVVLVLVLLVVMLAFKRFWMPLLLGVPLLMGVIITAAIGTVIFGTLNLFTVFFAAVLFGLGIDFGVHLLSRYETLRKENHSLTQALQGALLSSGKGIVIGALTTAAAFLSFTVTSFKGFRQMGSVAGIGIMVLAIIMLLLVPAMIATFESLRFKTKSQAKAHRPQLTGLVLNFSTKGRKVAIAGLLIGLLALAIMGLKPIVFNYSLSAIYPANMESTYWQHRLEDAYNTRIETLSILIPSLEALEQAHKQLSSVEAEGFIKTKSLLSNMRLALYKPELNAATLKKLLPTLPQAVTESWVGQLDNQLVYKLEVASTNPIATLSDYESLERIVKDATLMQPTGFVALMMHLSKVVTSDVLLVGCVCALLIMVFLIITFKHWYMPLGMMIGLMLTLMSTWGLASILGLSLNLMSVIAFPIAIGIVIDGFVHIGHGLVHRPAGDSLGDLYRALLVTTLTTMIGFGSLSLVNHGGLSNLGAITMLAMAIGFCYQLFFLPLWYKWGKILVA